MKRIMNRILPTATILLCVMLLSMGVMGQVDGDYRTRATGDWNDNNAWQTYDGSSWNDCAADDYPGATAGAQEVTITGEVDITITSAVPNAIGSLTLGEDAGTGADYQKNSLIVNGNITITNAINLNTPSLDNKENQIVIGSDATLSCASINSSSTNENRLCRVYIEQAELYVTGDITMGVNEVANKVIFSIVGNGGTLTVLGDISGGSIEEEEEDVEKVENATTNVSGDFLPTTFTFIENTGTVNLNGANQTFGAFTYNNLTLSGSDIKTASGDISVNGILDNSVSLNMQDYTLSGNLTSITNSGTIETTNTSAEPIPSGKTWGGTIEFAALAGSQTVVAGTYNNLSLQNTSNSNSFSGEVTVSGVFTSESGGSFSTEHNLNFNGTTACGGGSLNATAGTITYGGTATNIIAGTYNNIVIPDNATLCGDITVNGSFTSGSSLDYNTYTISGLPTVSSVSATNTNGTFKIGDIIYVTVLFSKDIIVSGGAEIRLTLETGTTNRVVDWDETVTSNNTLTFPYEIQSDDYSTDLDYVSTTALELVSGTIQDASNNDATLTLPAPGAANSLSANKDIIVDGIVPTLTSVSIQSNNSLDSKLAKIGDEVTLSFTGSEQLAAKPTVTIATHSIPELDISNTSGNNWTATYTMVQEDTEETVPFTIDFNDIAGNSGMQVTTISVGDNVAFDKTRPTPTVSTTATDPTNTSPIPFTILFDEAVVGFSVDDISVTNGSKANFSGSSNSYSVDVTPTVEGVVSVSVGEGVCTDAAGNSNIASNEISLDYYTTAKPTLTSTTISSNNPNNIQKAIEGNEVTLVFESGRALDNVSVAIAGQAITGANLTSSGNNREWTAVHTMTSGYPEGVISFAINFEDATGTTGDEVHQDNFGGTNVVFDNTPPTAPTVTGTDYTNNQKPTWNWGADHQETGYYRYGFIDGSDWLEEDVLVKTFTPTENLTEGIHTLYVQERDDVLNWSESGSKTIEIDITNPTLDPVTIRSNNSNPAYVNVGDEITLDFTANEPITIGSVTIGGRVADVFNVTGNRWLAILTVETAFATNGEVPFEISCTDIATNSTVVSTTTNSSTVTFDNTAPTINTISTPSGTYKSGQNIDFTVKFDEEVIVTGSPELSFKIGDDDGFMATYLSGSGTADLVFRFVVGTQDASGITTNTDPIILGTATIADKAGNLADISYAETLFNEVIIDGVAPSTSSIARSTPTNEKTNSDNVTFQVTFSEPVKGIAAGSFTLYRSGSVVGTIGTPTANGGGSIDNIWDVPVSGVDGDGILRLELRDNGTGITDEAGNPISGGFTTGENYTIDNTPPAPPTISGITQGRYSDNKSFTIEGETNATIFYSIEDPESWIEGTGSTLSATSGTEQTFFVKAYQRDEAGNESSTTDVIEVTIDKISPTILSIIGPAAKTYAIGESLSFTVELSKPVNVDDTPELTFTIGANTEAKALYQSGSGTESLIFSYTVAEGDLATTTAISHTANPIIGTIADIAGNAANLNISAQTFDNVFVDGVRPTVTSINRNNPANENTILTTVEYLITFNESVGGVTPNSFHLHRVGSIYGNISTAQTVSGNSKDNEWFVEVTDIIGEGTIRLDLKDTGTGIGDAVGNELNTGSTGGQSYTIYSISVSIDGTSTHCYDATLSVPITFEMSGQKPFTLEYKVGADDPVIVENIDAFTHDVSIEGLEAGVHNISLVKLTDQHGNSIVDAINDATITVNPLPDLTLNIIGSPFNVEDSQVNIKPYASPEGGLFSGDGVSSVGFFYPSMIDIDESTTEKVVPISYQYTDPNGCTNSTSQNVVVSTGGTVIEGLQPFYCQYDEQEILTATNPNDSIGTFDVTAPTDSWEDYGDNTLTIRPNLMTAGEHTINYTYIENETTFETQRTFTIDSIGSAIDFITLEESYCADASAINLQAVNIYPAGGTGHFSGPEAGFVSVENSNTAFFDPSSVVSKDSTYTISYYYRSPQGCQSDTISKQVTVHSLPEINFDIRSNYNFDETPITLSGSPTDGVFSGRGIDNNTLYPNRVNPDTEFDITYEYTDVNGCTNSDEKSTIIYQADETIENLSGTYCYDDEMVVTISCEPLVDPNITGTFVSQKGAITNIGNNQAEFKIADAWDDNNGGHDIVSFEYEIDGTPYQVSKEVYVDNIKDISITISNNEYCIDANPVPIISYRDHPFGSGQFQFRYMGSPNAFSITGDGAATFYPASETPGSHTLHLDYISTTSNSGCTAKDSIDIVINPLPIVSFSLESSYKIEEEPIELLGEPAGGQFTGNNIEPDNLTFNPGLTELLGSTSVTYSYTDSAGCSNTFTRSTTIVAADATIHGFPASRILCIDGDSILIRGEARNGLPGGSFTGNGIYNAGPDSAYFNPQRAGEGYHTITFQYISNEDNISTINFSTEVYVEDMGSVEFSNLNQTLTYCNNDSPIDLEATPEGGSFTVNNRVDVRFNPANAIIGTNRIVYTVASTMEGSGCTIRGEKEVVVNPMPEVGFNVPLACTNFEDDSVQFVNTTESTDPVDIWLWKFDTGEADTSNLENPRFLYQSAGSKVVSLQATSAKGCSNFTSSSITVSVNPTANFVWKNECLTEDGTELVSTSTPSNGIASYQWVIGNDTLTGSTTNHLFEEKGEHSVLHHVTSPTGCKDSIVLDITMQPVVTLLNLPERVYYEAFEQGESDWQSRGIGNNDYSSWTLAPPTGDIITYAAQGDNAWFTDVSINNQSREQSEVVSPCFVLSGLEKPMVKLSTWSASDAGRDGAVIQYSTLTYDDNNQEQWTTLGSVGHGINWHNHSAIQTQPGGQFTGWSQTTDGWVSSRHSIDNLLNHEHVRFRIAYSADGNSTFQSFNGFAFDEFWIGNRKQTLLMEYFTNTEDNNSTASNMDIHEIYSNNQNDVVAIQYHTSSPSGDPLYAEYPEGPSSREFFYGVPTIPYSIVNGITPLSFSNIEMNQDTISTQTLKDPSLQIELNASGSGSISIIADITAHVSISNADLVFYCAAVSREVQQTLSSGEEVTLHNVIRSFIPDPAGTPIAQSLEQEQSESISLSWNPKSSTNTQNIELIGFVQDLNTGRILQSSSIDLSNIITSTQLEEQQPVLRVYPNPAKHSITVESNSTIQSIQILDISGRAIEQLGVNAQQVTLPVEFLKAGVYIIRANVANGNLLVTKFVKQHSN